MRTPTAPDITIQPLVGVPVDYAARPSARLALTHPLNSLDIGKPAAETRVVVAMSGGVDSAVVAARLKSEGYDVVGITLKLYDNSLAPGRKGTCCAGRDIGDARVVASQIGIPHYVLDYTSRFRESVIEPFAASYAAGETPVPCALCNNTVKFTDLLGAARDLGADILATGHYCATRRLENGRRALHRAADATRDQSYFLCGTTSSQLEQVRFPLGTLSKTQVRDLARHYGLAVAEKPDSQDICFVPNGRYTKVVTSVLGTDLPGGTIVDEAGAVLGRHEGVHRYTVGQRRGLALGGRKEPTFVLRIDAERREVVVGPREALETRTLTLHSINWLGDADFDCLPPDGLALWVRTRSTRPPVPATLFGDGRVCFPQAEMAVAAGQSCAFYDSDADGARVMGGGTVARNASVVSERRGQATRASLDAS